MSVVSPGEPVSSRRVVPDAVCVSCGCLCDDIELEIEGDRIVEARNACPTGRARFMGFDPGTGDPSLVDGRPADLEEGIERAARILLEARHPLVCGLGATTTDGQRAAVSLAEWLGACVDVSWGDGGSATLEALQTVGEVTCTLGEIRNRADLILLWRADPLESHPRLFSRYALDPPGLFVPEGRSGRYCVCIDVRETTSVREAADEFIAIGEDGEIEALWTLRALVKGVAPDPAEVEARTGVALETWHALVERMRAARYGVVFYPAAGANTPGARLVAHGIHSLVRDLNATARFVCLPLSAGGGNGVGARNVLTWRTSYPGAVRFSSGCPRYGPGEAGVRPLLERREADAALVVRDDSIAPLDGAARERLSRIPVIVLASGGDDLHPGAAVVIRTSAFGIQTAGTAYRMDGVPLPLRAVLPSALPSVEDVLGAIERRVRALQTTDRAGTEGA